VQIVIADTGPINYPILIGHIGILPALFHKIILPSVVRDELVDAPLSVRDWIATPPKYGKCFHCEGLGSISLPPIHPTSRDSALIAEIIFTPIVTRFPPNGK
jgi:hypothetical protein